MSDNPDERRIEIMCGHHIDLYISPDCPPIRIKATPPGEPDAGDIPGGIDPGGVIIKLAGNPAMAARDLLKAGPDDRRSAYVHPVVPGEDTAAAIGQLFAGAQPCHFVVVPDPDAPDRPDDV